MISRSQWNVNQQPKQNMPLKRIRRIRVMIVDDHPSFREWLKSFLQPLAAEVVECDNGQEAVARYREARPDCVLMDIKIGAGRLGGR
jgi:CheY-like chemotaxis protein